MATKSNPNEMSFFEHLEELRGRFLKSLIIWFLVLVVCLIFMKDIFNLLAKPYLDLSEGQPWLTTDPKEPFFAHLKAGLWASFILSSGIFFYQFWAFIGPGLEKKEKRFALPFIAFMAIFFLMGCWFSFSIAYPMVLEFLMGWNIDGLMAYSRTDYLKLLFGFVLAMGVSFETPMVIFLLAKLRLVTPRFLIDKFRHAILLIFVFAAVITPTPDFVTQTILAGPMILLYLLGLAAAWVVQRNDPKPVSASEETAVSIASNDDV